VLTEVTVVCVVLTRKTPEKDKTIVKILFIVFFLILVPHPDSRFTAGVEFLLSFLVEAKTQTHTHTV